MKRLIIIVEGHTEQEFVNKILAPYLCSKGIYNVVAKLILTSKRGRGGFVEYYHLKNTILPVLRSEGRDVVLTTFVDFFRVPTNMPNYVECMESGSNADKVSRLETSLAQDINDNRFIPYIQLCEFEALLFANNKGFQTYFDDRESSETQKIVQSYPNPETINTTPNGAPSKRILAIKSNYNKPIEGNAIALEVGITDMLGKCPHFSAWVERLIEEVL